MPLMSPIWIDGFLFFIMAVIIVVAVLDLCLSSGFRVLLRDDVIQSWRSIENSTYTGLVARDAENLNLLLQDMFGENHFGPTCIARSMIISIIITFVLSSIIYLNFTSTYFSIEVDTAFSGYFYAFLYYAPVNAALDWISLIVTMNMLMLVAQARTRLRMLAVILADVAFAVGIGIFAVVASAYLLLWATGLIEQAGAIDFGVIFYISTIMLFLSSAVWFTSLIPSLLYLFALFRTFVTKLLRPVLQRPSTWLVTWLAELKRGMLTAIAIVVGVGAKAIQVGLLGL